jgi:ATP-dependent DNA ligase
MDWGKMKPMLLTQIKQDDLGRLLTDPEFAFFPKLDGRRCLVEIDLPIGSTAFGRNGVQFSLPIEVKRALIGLVKYSREGKVILDGELMDDDTFYVFDMPAADFGPVHVKITTPFQVRYSVLKTLHKGVWTDGPVKLLREVSTPKSQLALIQRTLDRTSEGVVVRHRLAPYEPGQRSPGALKWKSRQTVDCVVMEKGWHGKANLVLGCYDEDGLLVEIGRVSALQGDGPKAKVGDIVEVTCSHVTPDGRLYHPTTPKLRFDKTGNECGMDQVVISDLRKVRPEGQ